MTLKILEVFDREMTSENNSEETEPLSPPSVENNAQPSLSTHSFSIESILSRKDPPHPQTEKHTTVSQNIGKGFRIEQLINATKAMQERVTDNRGSSTRPVKPASVKTTYTTNTDLNIATNHKGREREKEKIQGDTSKLCAEKATVLAPFYVPMARHCGSHQSLPERYVHTENVSPYSTEMFENFRSSSILRLRTKAEEHLKQLRVS